jgi:3-isopropylmalate/(R)-2-methylmalate dehydratase small subunit
MDKFTVLEGVAAPLRIINVDTDMIIPKQYLKTIKRTGLGTGLFSEMRYRDDGSENPDFVLNQPAYRKAQILVAGDNFGCGSSREHAPWALLDFGIRCVISTSFADIFRANCFRNGMLPVTLEAAAVAYLMARATQCPESPFTVDLEAGLVGTEEGWSAAFAVEPDRREALLQGLDEVGATLTRSPAIESFEAKHWARRPWLGPEGASV